MRVVIFYLISLSNITYNLFLMPLQLPINQRLIYSYHLVCILFYFNFS
jgi:hypothetical protein